MERVLGVLQEEGMKFPVIALAREQKVPAYGRTPNPNRSSKLSGSQSHNKSHKSRQHPSSTR